MDAPARTLPSCRSKNGHRCRECHGECALPTDLRHFCVSCGLVFATAVRPVAWTKDQKHLTPGQKKVLLLIARDGTLCYLCNEPFDEERPATVDHVVPLSRGGAKTPDNTKLAHQQCNWEKDQMLLEEYVDLRAWRKVREACRLLVDSSCAP